MFYIIVGYSLYTGIQHIRSGAALRVDYTAITIRRIDGSVAR